MKEIRLSGIPSMSVGKTADILTNAYSTLINHHLPVRTMPSVMLWGSPGIGKSQAVRQIAKRIETETGKTVHVTDVRLLLFNPIDLRGIPTANSDKTLAIWLKPQIFQMDDSEQAVNILFLDEISSAPQSVQAAAYQIALDRVVGEHRLPDNCIVIAAGNRTTDRSVAHKMPEALANRFLHIEVAGSFDAWKQWAVQTGIHEKVLAYLTFRQDSLMDFEAGEDQLAFPTPRSWEMVSNILTGIQNDVELMYPLIAGVIGTGAAMEFRTWSTIFQKLPKMEDIFDGKKPTIPQSTDALYALTAAMTAYARNHRDETERISNSIRYSESLPPDFQVVLLKDYINLEPAYEKTLLQIPEFRRWVESKGRLLNGVVS